MTQIDDPEWIKAFFLGPKSENETWLKGEIESILSHWFRWRQDLFPDDPYAILEEDKKSAAFLQHQTKLSQNIRQLNDRLRDEVPKYSPRYIGHMVSEISLPAMLGHMAALVHNPNNTSKESARVTLPIEKEAIEMLAEMVGYDPDTARGHFTSGGTIANFESIWRARFRMDHWISLSLYLAEEKGVIFNLMHAAHMGWDKYFNLLASYDISEDNTKRYSLVGSNPFEAAALISKHIHAPYKGPVVLVPGNKHFSWSKGVNIFGLGDSSFWAIPLDDHGKLDVAELSLLLDKAEMEMRPVMMVVSVTGTTEAGEIDPVHKVQDVLDSYRRERGLFIWHHIDAAYGGFICTILGGNDETRLKPENSAALKAISRANSITLDPHKLGYVPYSCGAFLARDNEAYSVSTFKAPYLDRKDLGESVWASTMEGSRSGAGATATWLTGKTIGFNPEGFGQIIGATFKSAKAFREALEAALPFAHVKPPVDSNIVCFSLAGEGDSLIESNRKTNAVFAAFAQGPNFSVSRTTLSAVENAKLIDLHVSRFKGRVDTDHLVLIRCVFMNPFWSVEAIREALIPEFIDEVRTYYEAL
mgnify:CR=1 FL=1